MEPLQWVPEELPRLRRFLTDAGYTTSRICERVGAETIHDFRSVRDGRPASSIEDGLDLLIRLFLDAEAVDVRLLDPLVGDGFRSTAVALGLVQDHPEDAERCIPTMLLYPTEDLYIVSDLGHDPTQSGGWARRVQPDAVYPAITRNAAMFLAAQPRTAAQRLLDLGAGTGIAALRGARLGGHAWAVDITERSTQCARFNAALNGLDNVTALQGDLYEPVAGLTFDRIVAHPPYMPALEQVYVYRDGGADGEQLTRRIVAGLPTHLEAGGRFYCSCLASDREGEPLEQRLRQMLGEQEAEFDVLLVSIAASTPAEYYGGIAAAGRQGPEQARRHQQALEELGVRRLVLSSMLIQRHDTPRSPVTARRQAGSVLAADQLEWLLRWETATQDDGLSARLTRGHPTVSPHVRLETVSTWHDGRWQAQAHQLHTTTPFARMMEVPPSVVEFLGRCDGQRTLEEHLTRVIASGALPPQTTALEFATMIRPLLESGFLAMEGFPLPSEEGGFHWAAQEVRQLVNGLL